ncbi:MAG TPA: hypothetical protein VLI54_04620 [Bacillota bacterium]|nr:hypothetical protein [Bacillota bacterium]
MSARSVFSEATLTKVEGLQRLDQKPIVKWGWRLGRWAIGGYSEPGFQYAAYITAPYICKNAPGKNGGHPDFIPLKGNPDAGPFPRFWNRVAALAIQSDTLKQFEKPLKDEGVEAYHAVAYRSEPGQPIHVGVLPGDPYEGFGFVNPARRGAAVRQGIDATEASLALWIPTERAIVIPAGVQLETELLQKQAFSDRYPQVPIV